MRPRSRGAFDFSAISLGAVLHVVAAEIHI
jgi:hypothetical protein